MRASPTDTIIALSTPQGEGAIGIIRLSGELAIEEVDRVFFGKKLTEVDGNTVHYGKIKNDDGLIVDECLATIFRAPRSYTREDLVELSCHGSSYIIQQIITLFLTRGIRQARPGEFTQRAYLNGQLDLSQAEAVADLIAARTQTQHQIAIHQMRGGFSKEIKELREQLIEFASLIELENDFGEEDVEFADRTRLIDLCTTVCGKITSLKNSFSYGQAIKEGVPVVIVGKPNVGKSTLLNALLRDDKAIISDIPGTTRDVIEDTIQIDGILFRFMDTAGIRRTEDVVENLGIERTFDQLKKARIVIYITEIQEDHMEIVSEFKALNLSTDQQAIILLNKIDEFHTCHAYDIEEAVSTLTERTKTIAISAKNQTGLDQLQTTLSNFVKDKAISNQDIVVSNLRHFEALKLTEEHLNRVIKALNEHIPSDLIALDIRHALHHLGEISGEITTDDLLASIFSSFCIGK